MKIMRSARWLFPVLAMFAIPRSSFAGVLISVSVAPPVLPLYEQPPCPTDGYIWTPGYWAYGSEGYFWVPGTWVQAPRPGLLWTPGYWGWGGGIYVWHAGYWGPHVGYYGGVNYGFGYTGVGYAGGEWRGEYFFYNRSTTNVHITNVHVYNRIVVNDVAVHRVSYNGGPGGLEARPNSFEERAMHEQRFEATKTQVAHEEGARRNREFLASVNHGRPSVAATARPAEFHHEVVSAREQHAPRPADNRHVDTHAMNRPVPHPKGPPHPDNRGVEDRFVNRNPTRPRPPARTDRRARPVAQAVDHRPSRTDNHGGPGPRSTAHHAQAAPRPQYGNAPRGGRGNGHRDERR